MVADGQHPDRDAALPLRRLLALERDRGCSLVPTTPLPPHNNGKIDLVLAIIGILIIGIACIYANMTHLIP